MWLQSARQADSIFAPVATFYFSAKEADDFHTFLTTRSDGTEIVPIVDVAQLRLSASGFLRNGYRFTIPGFNSVCYAISPGLSAVFHELSGENPRKIDGSEEFSVPTAVSIYNAALQSRFSSLLGRRLLMSHNEKLLEGFFSMDHSFLDNSVFFDIVKETMAEQQPQAQFYKAEVIGREIVVYMLDPGSVRKNIVTDPRHVFGAGWVFSNREDTGTAVQMAACLFTKFGVAIQQDRKLRAVHVGGDIRNRVKDLCEKAARQTIDMAAVAKRVQQLLQRRIGFSDDKEAHASACEKAVAVVQRHGPPRQVAETVVQNAASVGADLDTRDFSITYDPQVLYERNLYDLVCSMLRYSKSQPATTRFQLQSAAMAMLLPGSIKGKKKRRFF
jgi:hypothetical protein